MEDTGPPDHSNHHTPPGILSPTEVSENFTFSQYQYPKSRVILIGDSGTGKTSLVKRLATGEFEPMCTPTIGIDYHLHTLRYHEANLPASDLALDIWDSAGQERFRSISSSYFKNISGVLLVFDLSNPKTFRNLEKWIEYVYEHTTEDRFVFLVIGNKGDLEPKVSPEEISKFCSDHNLHYLTTSSLDSAQTNEVFHFLGRQMLMRGFYKSPADQETPLESGDRTLSLHRLDPVTQPRERSRCCVVGGSGSDTR